jgi:SpoIID/LytB domain protein
MRRASLLFSVVVVVVLSCPWPSASAQLGGPIGAPVVFRPKPGTTLTLEGRGPFRGTVEVRREGEALTVVNELDIDHYVMGVREVPGSWPMEALKAQAVAARTYALWEVGKGYWKRFGFDVCATVSCQVYQGATAEQGERGRRWSAAVKATAGQVLFDADGKPALTRYHSSSGGRTLPNEVVYPTDGPRPYLRAVDDPYDEVSPLHRWNVSFTRDRLQTILHDGIGLNGELTGITVDEASRKLTITTKGGRLEMTTVRFRREISEQAPRSFPTLYPATRPDGERMPFTLASSRFTIEETSDGFVVHGRGYGHGVGMSQWGAMGRAKDGQRYDEILAAYYGGLRPKAWTGQRTIRVAIVRGIGSALVSGDGAFGVTTNGQALARSTLGGWATAISGVRSVAVSPPRGYSLPLALTGVVVPDEVIVDPPMTGETLDVGFVVPKAAQVTAVLTREGEEVARTKVVVEAGERKLEIPLDPDELARRASYTVKLAAYDGTRTVDAIADVVLVKPGASLLVKILWAAAILVLVGVLLRSRAVRRARLRGGRAETSVGTPG